MEQKRLLWIIAAVGVFLLVVLGAALIIYAPAAKTPQTLTSIEKKDSNTANSWISLAPESSPVVQENLEQARDIIPETNEQKNADSIRSEFDFDSPTQSEEIKVRDVTIRADNATVYSGSSESKDEPKAQTIINNTTTIDLTTPVPPVEITRAAAKPIHKIEPAAEKPRQKPVPTVTYKNTSTVSEKPSTVVVNNKATIKTAPKKATVTKYWVQVTSLTSRKNADAAREVLAKNQINADVFTYTNNKNQLYYRVRVGPYTTKTEAEYWRSKISQIDNFKNTASYVTSTTSDAE